MVKINKHFYAIIFLFLISTVSVYSAIPSIDGVSVVVVNPADDEKAKTGETTGDKNKKSEETKPDSSTIITEKVIDDGNKPKTDKTSKIETGNQSESTLSYNFVFYLMYRFKIDEIFHISKSNQEVNRIPDQSMLYERGKRLFNKLVQEFEL